MLVALLGYFIITFTLAAALKRDAARAYALAPYDGRTTGRLAAALSGPEADAAARRRAYDLAKAALTQGPVNVAAASALGVNAQVRGEAATARRAFTYADRLSRRDLITQLWAIEDAVARGDVGATIRHYDITLRVRPEMGGVLFPILVAASSEAPIRSELVRTLAAKPAWQEPFVNFAAGSDAEPRVTAALFDRLRRAGVPIPQAAQGSLLNALFAKGYRDQAWAYYASIRPGAARDRSRDPRFLARLEAPTRFDWTTISDGAVTGVIEPGAFDFSAPASVGGPMLQQVQLLPPGSYRLVGHSADIDQPDDALPYWSLTCQDGRELGRVDVPRSDQSRGTFAGTFRVPAGCPVQTLTLVARQSSAVTGLSGRIDRALLSPLP